LPDKIDDRNFMLLSDSKTYEIQNKIQLFILAHLKTTDKIMKTLDDLKYFRDDLVNCPETQFSFNNKRRQFRQDVKKHFRHKNENLVIFFDIEIYLENDWDKFKFTIDKLIENLEKYKKSIDNENINYIEY
jgi:hypothetical protein